LVISKCVTAVKVSNFTGDYLPNRSTLDIGVLGVFGIVSHKEHPPEVWSLPPVTPCIYIYIYMMFLSLPCSCTKTLVIVVTNNLHTICKHTHGLFSKKILRVYLTQYIC